MTDHSSEARNYANLADQELAGVTDPGQRATTVRIMGCRRGPAPDPCDNWPRCLGVELSAPAPCGVYCRRPGERVPIGALPHKAPSQF